MFSQITKRKKIILFSIIVLAGLLRILFLDIYPPALYSDEVNQGYNAYSILKTGRDEHKKWFPVSFRSFGDWKPPVQTYAMVPTIAIFGLNAWGVRLPGAILGVLTIPLLYFLVKELLNQREEVALLAAGFLAISPWHIHHSRMAMLTVIALFFLVLGVFSFLKGLKNPKWFIISAMGFALSVYSYYGMRLLVPLFGLFLITVYWKKVKWTHKWFVLSIVVGFFLMSPLLVSFIQSPDVVFGRAKTVSVFYDQGINLTLWDRIAQEGSSVHPWVARFFHNKPSMYTFNIMQRFLSHFDGRFLFLTGDGHLPFQLPNMGVLYILDGVFLIAGSLFLFKQQKKMRGILFFWLIASVLPAAFTFLTPAANRSFNMIVPITILVAYGLIVGLRSFHGKIRNVLIVGVGIGYLGSFVFFFYQYTVVLPREHADWWLYGNREIVSYVNAERNNFDEIIISGKLSMPYIYFLFFNQTDPEAVWKTTRRDTKTDEFGFEHVSAIEGVRFPRNFSWEKDFGKFSPKTLLITTPQEEVGKEAEIKDIIYYPNGTEAYRIYLVTHEIL